MAKRKPKTEKPLTMEERGKIDEGLAKKGGTPYVIIRNRDDEKQALDKLRKQKRRQEK